MVGIAYMHGEYVPGTVRMRRSSWGEKRRRGEIKGTKELRCVEEDREKREDGDDVDLGDAQELGGVHVVPVSEFVG